MSNTQSKVGVIVEVDGEQYALGTTLIPDKPHYNRQLVYQLTRGATQTIISKLLERDLVKRMPSDLL